jgi:hypothetical protein
MHCYESVFLCNEKRKREKRMIYRMPLKQVNNSLGFRKPFNFWYSYSPFPPPLLASPVYYAVLAIEILEQFKKQLYTILV